MRELTCIVCPKGCHLLVDDDLNVTGNLCPRGKQYGYNEVTHPMRNITSTVRINSTIINRLPVKTSGDLPKELMFEAMKEINKVVVTAPVAVGDILLKNILDTGVDLLATRTIEK